MLWNWIENVVGECQKSLRSFFKFPQAWLAVSVLVVCLSLYLLCCDIRFLDLLLIVIVIPALAYAFGVSYYTSAVITIKHDNNMSYKIVTDGKEYRLEPDKTYIKIYFSQQGDHKVYLYSDNGTMKDGPQTANTYEHHIAYVEFPKENYENKVQNTTGTSETSTT